jgi:HlyD family secretion protein
MKKTVITTAIVVFFTLIALIIFNKVTSREDTDVIFTESKQGRFEITVTTTGELIAEHSVDIKGPEFTQGRDVRSTNIKITDLVPEGTEVKAGDYVATLDRTELENSLKDARERLTTFSTNLEMALLDTAMTMNSIRDQISNQIHIVTEAEITLRNSKYENPTTIREAEINLDQARRTLDQFNRTYTLREAQTRTNIKNIRMWLGRMERRVKDYEDVLAAFIITAPSDGMIIYKRDRFGNKRKVGSMINPIDRVVATLPDLSSMISKIYVSEIEITKVKPGQTVIVTVDAFPTKTYNGSVMSIANIGEKLNNSDSKVFEVLVKIEGSDPALRPSMTTNNKVMIKSLEDVTYIPIECVHTGTDGIPFVYTKDKLKQVVSLGESNEEDVVINQGIKPGTQLYVSVPEKPEKFKLSGGDRIKKGSD